MDARLYEFTPPQQAVLWRQTANLSVMRMGDTPLPVRRFTDENIQRAIDSATSRLEGSKTGAVVAHADGDGVSLSVVGKLGGHWSVAAAAYKPYNGKLSAEAEVVYSW